MLPIELFVWKEKVVSCMWIWYRLFFCAGYFSFLVVYFFVTLCVWHLLTLANQFFAAGAAVRFSNMKSIKIVRRRLYLAKIACRIWQLAQFHASLLQLFFISPNLDSSERTNFANFLLQLIKKIRSESVRSVSSHQLLRLEKVQNRLLSFLVIFDSIVNNFSIFLKIESSI